MSYSKSIPFFLLSLLLICHATHCAEPLYNICFSEDNYTLSSPYKTNLDRLLSTLAAKVPPTGFGTATSGDDNRYRVYGLSLCRGDVETDDCKTCVINAGKELKDRCPKKKGAIIWYDNCLLKYSDTKFFGEIDTKNKFYLLNVADVDMDFMVFFRKIKKLLSSLTEKATASPRLYDYGDLKIDEKNTLFGLVQCTRDLSSADCKQCLEEAISELPSCCYGKRGGRTVGASCNVRYELYPFVGV